MYIEQIDNTLVFSHRGEKVTIEPWGKNALRVRATKYGTYSSNQWALEEPVKNTNVKIEIQEQNATITNGKLSISVNPRGVLTFYKNGTQFLQEYYRNYDFSVSNESICLKLDGRMYQPIIGGDYEATVRFNADDSEHFYGMGAYQQPYLDLKGCSLELAQRNSQTSIPFVLSSKGYGFLWNHPGTGTANFAKNYTEWKADALKEIDYWITVDDSPKEIIENYMNVVGKAPEMPSDLLGLWQCKLRYRTQEEVLSVAREYHRRNIHIDVIVIDFFHWTRQGDWQFDPAYWPDPKAMCDEIHSYGTKVVVSVWPSVDRKSIHFQELYDRGLLIQTEHGAAQTYDYQGDCVSIDITNPQAQKFLFDTCKKNYADFGIDMFWLDNCEPDYGVYDYSNFRYSIGTALECTNIFPKLMAKTFYDGLQSLGKTDICHLVRCGWVGSQKYGALLWSGDVNSTFESLRDQISIGLNMGIAGIPWWNSDVGGFMTQDIHDPEFQELLVRWFEYAVFTPVLRLHGDRGPHDITPLSTLDYGGGYLYTGHNNELWSYGEKIYNILYDQLKLRWNLKPYLEKIFHEAHTNVLPLLRTMFLEYPEDENCWNLEDQYMFGDQYLVAPVYTYGQRERRVYLPEGKWISLLDNQVIEGRKWITAAAPLSSIPVFKKA